MFQARQINLLLSTAREYQQRRVPLERFLYVLEGILAVLDDSALYELLHKESLDLELIYANTCIEGRALDDREKSAVDAGVADVIAKAEAYLSKLPREASEDDAA